MRNAWIWIVVVVIILVGGFLWWQSSQSTGTPSPTTVDVTGTNPVPTETTSTTTNASSTTGTSTNTGASAPVTITYDGRSFTPATVTVKKGDSVTWTASGGQMWIASAPHPAHTGYDGTSRTTHCAPGYTGPAPLDECVAGASFTFTFDKVGTWPYHDHLNPSAFGKVVVTE
jgi:plastocyanin